MPKLFISYSRQTASLAANVVKDLQSLGHHVWLDLELTGGQSWWVEILRTIRDCDAFIFLLDDKSVTSLACQREFAYAADLGKSIVPVLVGDGVSLNLMPPELARLQFIDYRVRDRSAALSLARALASVPDSRSLPDPLPQPPDLPISFLGSLARRVDAASLSFEEQSTVLVDLMTSIRDLEVAGDAQLLLARFRKRRDLYVLVANEIDEARRRKPKAVSGAGSRSRAKKTRKRTDKDVLVGKGRAAVEWFTTAAPTPNKIVDYADGSTIFSQGDPCLTVMFIRSGIVRLSVVSRSRQREVTVGTLRQGDFLGEGALAGQRLRMSSATAVGSAQVVIVQKDDMVRHLHKPDSEFSRRFIEYMVSRSARVEEDLVDQLFNSSEKRLARLLLLAASSREDGRSQKVLPKLSPEMLAEMIGATRSRVNFFLSKFRQQGFIEYIGDAKNNRLRINSSLLSVVLLD